MGRSFPENEIDGAFFSHAAAGANDLEMAEYIHQMLSGLHGLIRHPKNQNLKVMLWLARNEAKRVLDETERSSAAPSAARATAEERPGV